MANDAALIAFLTSHFRVDDLNRLVHTVDPELVPHVGWRGSAAAVAFEVVQRLGHRGLIADTLRDALIEIRPALEQQIDAVFAGGDAVAVEDRYGAERKAAYTALWPRLRPMSTFDRVPLEPDLRRTLVTALTDWYFDELHGLYISDLAQVAYRLLLHALVDSEVGDDVVRTRASWLRGIVVRDLGTRTSTSPVASSPPEDDQDAEFIHHEDVVQRVLGHELPAGDCRGRGCRGGRVRRASGAPTCSGCR
ncbi:MAG: hypothetical protein ACI9K2_006559, partial [Myxococcota bacterium]